MPDSLVIDDPAEGVRRLTLSRPDALNAFTFEMYAALRHALEAVAGDPAVRVVVLTGAGRGFCAGHDIRAGGEPEGISPDLGRMQRAKLTLGRLTPLPGLLRALPQPVIAAVNGVAAGVGFALAISCDLVVMGQSGRFVNAIHNAATGAELGMSWLLPRLVGLQRAAEILYTARPVGAEEAVRIGLALRAVDDAALMDEVLGIARDIAVNVPIGIWSTKQALWHGLTSSFEAAIELESRGTHIAQTTEDAREKRAAMIEKRPPIFVNR